MAVSKLVGASVKRREDPRFLTGKGNFTDDVKLPGLLSLAILRSSHAHARITRLDVSQARALPGVVAVYTGADLVDKLNPVPTAWLVPNSNLKVPAYRALATDKVRYVGDGIAAVVAESRYIAEDALELIEVDYDVLPAIVNQEKATEDGAPQLYDDVPNNIAFDFVLEGGDVEGAFREAEVTVQKRFINQRLIANAIETRGAVASYDRNSDEITLWCTSQNPHVHRFLLSAVTGIPETNIRVIAPDVGGGFGSKIPTYSGEMIACAIAKDLGRSVKWFEERRENYVATAHGRDHIEYVEIAAKRDGTITGLRVKSYANMGAYLSTAAPGVPTWLFGLMVGGAYDLRNVRCEVIGAMTNTTPTDAYRGAGRPEATYIIERMMDLVADEIGMDRAEIRRKNFIPSEKFPYTIACGAIAYDSGNYDWTLDRALEIVDYQQLKQQQAEARAEGRLFGIGISTYVEVCGLAPSPAAGAMGWQGGLYDCATVRVHPTANVTVFSGAAPHGQGEYTTFAQLASDELGVPISDIEIVWGDTDRIPFGWGTYGSRTTAVAGSALVLAARKVREKAAKIAAHMLEVSPDEIVFDQGNFHVKGAPDRVKTFPEVTTAAYLAWDLPPGITPGLEETHFFDPESNTYPFGAHICIVEVLPDTGMVEIKRYVAVDDIGNVINPMIVDGQLHGGIAQGISQALFETAVYEDNGQLLSATMMDYTVPKANVLPNVELDRTVTPCPFNPMGIKGVGEAGSIASTAAVMNAIIDALHPLGIDNMDMPATPQRLWQVIQERKGNETDVSKSL